MAKGDKTKVQNVTDVTKQKGEAQVGNLMQDTIIPKTQETQNLSTLANQQAFGDYGNLMGKYEAMPDVAKPSPFIPITSNPVGNVNYQKTPEFGEGLGYYRNFANTGGFSPTDIQDMRARGVSPIRSAYANAQQNIDRQRSLSGGYAPNYIAATEKMSRTMPGQIAEANQNVNAQLAQMVQQGKMFGTQGFGNMSQRDLELMTQVALQNQQNQQANEGRNLSAAGLNLQGQGQYNNDIINANNANLNRIGAMGNLYSATPGLANQFANQFQGNVGNWLNAQGMQNQINQNAVSNQLNASQIPSNFETGLGRVGQIAQIGGQIAAPFMGSGGNIANLVQDKGPLLPNNATDIFKKYGSSIYQPPNQSGQMVR